MRIGSWHSYHMCIAQTEKMAYGGQTTVAGVAVCEYKHTVVLTFCHCHCKIAFKIFGKYYLLMGIGLHGGKIHNMILVYSMANIGKRKNTYLSTCQLLRVFNIKMSTFAHTLLLCAIKKVRWQELNFWP